MKPDQYIGITETGDPAFDPGCFDRLHRANIIITKRLTYALAQRLLENRDRCILHLTCTGWGGTDLEPMVPSVNYSRRHLIDLVEDGFPAKQVVLRIDPVVPTEEGLRHALNVIEAFRDTGVTRIRVSFLDMYNHVRQRFLAKGFDYQPNSFHAPLLVREQMARQIAEAASAIGAELKFCGEPGFPSTPCISQKDIDILGLTGEIILQGGANQRTTCHCPGNKRQILTRKPGRCENRCLYCYWKNDS